MLKFPFFKKCNLSQLTLEVNWVCRPKVKTRNVKQQSERAVFLSFLQIILRLGNLKIGCLVSFKIQLVLDSRSNS